MSRPAAAPTAGSGDGRRRCRPVRLALLSLFLMTGVSLDAVAQQDISQPRKAYVPSNAPQAWPTGQWNPVPTPILTEFLRDQAADPARVRPTAYVEHALYRAELTSDFALEGSWNATVRRPDGTRPLIELGAMSVVLTDVTSAGVPAVYGTDPYGRTLLYVDHSAGTLTGRWSLAGRSILDRVEFPVRIPAAAASRCEITVPAGWRLKSSHGLVREPQPAERNGWMHWTVELGQHSECVWTLRKSDSPPAPDLLCDRSIVYTIRPDGNRIQSEFSIQSLDDSASEIVFLAPAELRNPTVTYSAATSLPARIFQTGDLQRLVVSLPNTEPGRLGSFRIAGEFPPSRDDDAPLPVVSLEGGIILRGTRRVDVDRPLTLKSLNIDGLRQSTVNFDESGTDWSFEELRPDGRIFVHVGQPQTSITALVATHITSTIDGPRFRAVVSLQARTGSTFRTTLELPSACDIVDVYPSANIDKSGISHWGVSRSGDKATLSIEFRQALQSQLPKQVEITGRWMDRPASPLRISAFPVPLDADDWQVLLAVSGISAARDASPRPIEGTQLPSNWAPHLQLLRLAAADPGLTWYIADGASPSGEIVINATLADDAASPVGTGAVSTPGRQPSRLVPESPGRPALSLTLHSLLSTSGSDALSHDARYTWSGNVESANWNFQLPDPATLDSVFVDGRAHATEVLDHTVSLAPLPPDAHQILVRFRTPAATGSAWMQNRYHVPLPRWNVPVVSLRWSIGLPLGHSIAGSPLDPALGPCASEPSWPQRLFAPWVLSGDRSWFNPFSKSAWRDVLVGPDPAPAQTADATPSVTFLSLDPPYELSLNTWDLRTANRLAQLSLVVCLACAVAVRRVAGRQALALLAITAAATLFTALSVPHEYGPLAGGGLLGLIAGGLLPSRWVQQRDLLAGWQLRPRTAPGMGATGLAALLAGHCLWLTVVQAQEPRPDPDRPAQPRELSAETPGTDEFDVLLPYENATIAPVGYLEARRLAGFTDWLRREYELPEYLLRSVQYQVSDSDPALIRAILDVVVLSDARRVTVVLPFHEITFRSPDDCEVDGRRTQVRPMADDNGFAVEVEPPSPPEGVATTPHAAPVPRPVEVAVWFQMIGSDGSGGYRCRVPPVNDARLYLPAAVLRRGLHLSSAQGARYQDEHGNLEYDLGGAHWIGVDRVSDEVVAQVPLNPLRAEAATLVEVHPMRLQARTQIDLSPPGEEFGLPLPRRLNLLLPGRSEVRQVWSDSLREYRVWYSGTAVTVLEIDFNQRLAGRQKIEIEYAIPFDPRAASEVPAIELLDGERLLSHRIGLRAAPGMQLELDRSALVPGGPEELLPDRFREGLPPDTEWPPPDAAFSALAPGPIPIRLNTLEPARSVAVEQTVTIESRALRLEAQAQLDVSGTQVFEHKLLVPVDFRIDALSVDQDGANRLLDWSRDGDRLVVHLREGRSGRQLLKIRGWLPLQVGETTRFPALEFQETTTRSSDLILRDISGQRVELFAEGGVPLLPGLPARTAAADATIRRYAGPGPNVPVSCRVVPIPVMPHLQTMSFLERRDQAWTLTTVCHVGEQPGSATTLTLQVPRQLGQQFHVTPREIVRSSRVSEDGSLELNLHWSDAAPAIHAFQMTAPLAPPGESHWSLPLPRFPPASGSSRLLVLPPDIRYTPDASTAVPIESAEWLTIQPMWSAAAPAIADGQPFRIIADDVLLKRSAESSGDTTTPDLLETIVWDNADGSALGLTVVYLSAVRRPFELRLELPRTVQIAGALDGGRIVETRSEHDSSVVCVIQSHSTEGLRRVAFLWRRSAEIPGRRWTASPLLPTLPGLALDRQFVTIVPPRDRQYLLRGPASLQSPEIYRMRRAEQLLELIGGHGDPGHGPTAGDLLDLAREFDSEISLLSRATWSDKRLVDRFAALHGRWQSIRDAAWLAPTEDAAQGSADRALLDCQRELISGAISQPDAVLLQPVPDDSRLRFWSVSDRAARIICGLLVVLALSIVLIAWHSIRRRGPASRSGPRMDYFGLLVFGLLWWSLLRFGALGLVLVVVAVGLQAAAWLRPGPTPAAPAT